MADAKAVVEAHDNPPWYARHPDGSIHFSGVPDRLVRHPELVRRGIVLDDSLKPGVVFRSIVKDPGPADRGFVIKVIDPADEELEIYERLLGDISSPQNHTIPCEIVRNGHPILIMPMISEIDSMIVGRRCRIYVSAMLVEYSLHQHLTILCFGWEESTSTISTHRDGSHVDQVLNLRLLYQKLRHFPPNGLSHFDPYSWDVYCLGILLNEMMDGVVFRSIAKDHGPAGRGFVVKVLDLADEELEIYERLLARIDAPQNHTIPCEIVRNGHPMLIMPMLSRIDLTIKQQCNLLSDLLDIFYQLIEGVNYLHRHHIAHMAGRLS
ncbi:hypothetical protein ONZ51_g10644 [Trametes cubensis]|uniref:Protein kinase domain-containing protein n=1 Tax=Trametes cubensis TaxID=1111947 RepID=A0AAD7TKV2_9APHY|nr:hypothetical protein ONZ51_g10644 [Trametes cubensis]